MDTSRRRLMELRGDPWFLAFSGVLWLLLVPTRTYLELRDHGPGSFGFLVGLGMGAVWIAVTITMVRGLLRRRAQHRRGPSDGPGWPGGAV